MARITNITDFKNYLKSMLGSPVITVELSEAQYENIIYDTIQDFQRYNYNEGSYKDYIVIDLSAGQMYYDLSGTNVEGIIDLYLSVGSQGNINVLFSPVNMLLGGNAGVMNLMQYGMADYYSAMMYLREITNTFSVKYNLNYNPTQERLTVTPTPEEAMRGMLEVYKRETSENLYNHTLVKKLALARCKVLWGRNIGKFAITLPGGGTMNGSEIRSEGEAEEEKLMNDISNESEPIDFFCG
jgi:hypothetical protein